jgi:hypothetical protein
MADIVNIDTTAEKLGTFKAKIGDTSSFSVKLWDDDAKTVPTDLTGCEALLQVKTSSGALQFQYTMADGITISGNAFLFKKICDAPKAGEFEFDLQITYANGTVKTYTGGVATLIKEISKNA